MAYKYFIKGVRKFNDEKVRRKRKRSFSAKMKTIICWLAGIREKMGKSIL